MFKRLISLLAASAFFVPFAQSAEPGTKGLTRDAVVSSTTSCSIREGRYCYFAFGDSGGGNYQGNSSVFTVMDADICFNSDTATDTDSGAVVTVYRVVSAANGNGSMVPTASSASTLNHSTGDCFHAVSGRYWIETTTEPTDGTKTAVVSVTERNR